MKLEDSLPCSKQTTTCLYREPDESIPHPHILFTRNPFQNYPNWSFPFRFTN